MIRKKKVEFELDLNHKQMNADFELEEKRRTLALEIEYKEKENQLTLDHYKSLHNDAGVDVTKVLTARYSNIDKSIQIVGSDPSITPQLHLKLDAPNKNTK